MSDNPKLKSLLKIRNSSLLLGKFFGGSGFALDIQTNILRKIGNQYSSLYYLRPIILRSAFSICNPPCKGKAHSPAKRSDTMGYTSQKPALLIDRLHTYCRLNVVLMQTLRKIHLRTAWCQSDRQTVNKIRKPWCRCRHACKGDRRCRRDRCEGP